MSDITLNTQSITGNHNFVPPGTDWNLGSGNKKWNGGYFGTIIADAGIPAGTAATGGDKIGQIRFSINPNIEPGYLALNGQEVNREDYPNLWAWVQQQVGFLIEESEWQSLSAAHNGNVGKYSVGNGSTTFRLPNLGCWVRGGGTAGTATGVGGNLDAGLPNITGHYTGSYLGIYDTNDLRMTGPFYDADSEVENKVLGTVNNGGTSNVIGFNASLANAIYGAADTVQPESIIGIWLVKAYHVPVDNMGNTITVNGVPPDETGNISVSTNEGVWKANEQVSAGDMRYLSGRENTGYLIEYLQSGTTGTTQPVVEDVTEIANWASFDRVGKLRFIFNLNDKDADEVLGCGILYNRNTYPELWEYAQLKNMVVTEAEWQAKLAENDGLFVPYYSDGDGSTTFRTPMYATYSCGVSNTNEIGTYKEAGLPNHKHIEGWSGVNHNASFGVTDVDEQGNINQQSGLSTTFHAYTSYAIDDTTIYGNADTVRPNTMYGVWVIKAVGIVVDSGNTDLVNMLTGIEQLQQQITALQNQISDSNNFAIIYPNGGTEEQPAEVSINSCYIEENPFPGYNVSCIAQISDGTRWASTGFINEGGQIGGGIIASQLLPDDKIYVMTGLAYLSTSNGNTQFSGCPLAKFITADLAAAPCRVFVYKLGKIEGDANV